MDVHSGAVWALLHELWGVAQHVRRGSESPPVDPVLVRLLAFVAGRDGARPSEIAGALDLTHPTVSRHITALDAAGEIEVEPDPLDGRSYRVHLSAQGTASLARFRDDLVDRFSPALDGWSAGDAAALTVLLARLNASMTAAAGTRSRGKTPGRNRWRAPVRRTTEEKS